MTGSQKVRRPGIKPGSGPWQGPILSLNYRRVVFVPRIELGTSRVLGERHNQLDHTNSGVSGFRSQYLVLAKDARFQLRQYPMMRTTPRGFEPLRSKTTHLAGEPLNHSGKVSYCLDAAATSSRNCPKTHGTQRKKK